MATLQEIIFDKYLFQSSTALDMSFRDTVGVRNFLFHQEYLSDPPSLSKTSTSTLTTCGFLFVIYFI